MTTPTQLPEKQKNTWVQYCDQEHTNKLLKTFNKYNIKLGTRNNQSVIKQMTKHR